MTFGLSLKKVLPTQFTTSRRPSVEAAMLGPIGRIRCVYSGCVGEGSRFGVPRAALQRGVARCTIRNADAPGHPSKEDHPKDDDDDQWPYRSALDMRRLSHGDPS